MTLTSYSVVPGVLDVRTNVESIHAFSYGEVLATDRIFDQETEADLSIRYEVAPSVDIPEEVGGKYHYFSGSEDGGVMAYRRPYLGNWCMKMVLLWEDEPSVRVNGSYPRFARFRMNNVYPPGTILTDVVSVTLLRNGYAPLHCACIARDNEATLIFAPPDTGKTLTSIRSVQNHGFQFVAEDITVTDGTNAYSCPWTSTFQYYTELEPELSTRAVNYLADRIPILGPFVGDDRNKITEHLSADSISTDMPVSNVVVLERGDQYTKELANDVALSKLLNLNRYEFHYWRNPMLMARAYYDDAFEPQQLMPTERAQIEQVLDGADAYVISTDDPTEYAGQVADVVED